MKLRYMVEYARRGSLASPTYEPIGVWVQGPGPGLDVEIVFLPGNDEAEEDANWVLNRLVEAGVKSLPDGFLEYHRDTMSPYRGMRGPIVETEEFARLGDAVASWLASIAEAAPAPRAGRSGVKSEFG